MTLAEKRLVVEALLCAAGDANNVSLVFAAYCIDGPKRSTLNAALDESYRLEAIVISFSDRLAIAAYRLIETSPVLRREWFGR